MKRTSQKKESQRTNKKKEKKSYKDELRERTNQSKDTADSSGFGRRALDLSGYDDVEFYKPTKGTNLVDILPYKVSGKNHPLGKEDGEVDYNLDYFVHFGVGPAEDMFVCPKKTFGKPCPICEEMELLRQQEADEKTIDALKPKRRVLYNVIDVNDESKGVQLFEASHFLFERELIEEAASGDDGEIVVFSDIEEGQTIKFRASEKSIGRNKFLEFKSFSFKDREPYEESVIDETISLDAILNVASYDEIYESLHSADIDDEDDDDDEEEPTRRKKTSSSKKKRNTKDEEEDDDDEEPDEDEEEDDDDEDEEGNDISDDPKKNRERIAGKKKDKQRSNTKQGKCPAGHKFGEDTDDYDECSDCEIWEECADEHDK